MHYILKTVLWQVFDINALDPKEASDTIVRSCLIDMSQQGPGPLSCLAFQLVRNRKEMYGAILKAGGTCAHGIGEWRNSYIIEFLQFIDNFDYNHDSTIIFGNVVGSAPSRPISPPCYLQV